MKGFSRRSSHETRVLSLAIRLRTITASAEREANIISKDWFFFGRFFVTPRSKQKMHCFFQSANLRVNCWFGLVVWDSRGTPKVANPFHFRGFQESKPPNAPNQQLITITLAKLQYFTNLDFPEIRRFPLLNHHLGEVVWGRYNLTRLVDPRLP